MWLLSIVLKPFILVVFFVLVWLIAAGLHKVIPEGRIKRILYSPLPWLRDNRRR